MFLNFIFSALLLLTPLKSPNGLLNLKSAQFDGSTQYATSSSTTFPAIAWNNAYTISFWVNHDNTANYNTIFDKGFATGTGWHVYFFNTTTLKFYASGSDGSTIRFSCTVPATTNWQHVAIVWDATVAPTVVNQKIYVAGVSQTLTNETDALTANFANTSNFYFGQRSDGLGFAGKVDEPTFWNLALSAGQVQAIYNNGHPQDVSTLSGYSSQNVSWFRDGDTPDNNTTMFDRHASNNLTWAVTPTYSTNVP